MFIYRDMPLRAVPKVLLDSAAMSAMLLYIITNAVMFAFVPPLVNSLTTSTSPSVC